MTRFSRAPFHMLLGTLLCSPAAIVWSQPAVADSYVRCAGDKGFFLRVEAARAVVTMGPRRIAMPRRDMPLGQYYRNAEAALVIDGAFVAFVPKGDDGWRDCRLEAAGNLTSN